MKFVNDSEGTRAWGNYAEMSDVAFGCLLAKRDGKITGIIVGLDVPSPVFPL